MVVVSLFTAIECLYLLIISIKFQREFIHTKTLSLLCHLAFVKKQISGFIFWATSSLSKPASKYKLSGATWRHFQSRCINVKWRHITNQTSHIYGNQFKCYPNTGSGVNPLKTCHPKLLNKFFDKQWRPRWNATWCCISSGSALHVKAKSILRERYTIFFWNYMYNIWPPIYNGPSWFYCIHVALWRMAISIKRVNSYNFYFQNGSSSEEASSLSTQSTTASWGHWVYS